MFYVARSLALELVYSSSSALLQAYIVFSAAFWSMNELLWMILFEGCCGEGFKSSAPTSFTAEILFFFFFFQSLALPAGRAGPSVSESLAQLH